MGSQPPEHNRYAQRQALLNAICELGVTARVAGYIAANYPADYLWRKVRQTRYARRTGLSVQPAGWFIVSVREGWSAPVGFDEWDELEPTERRAALAQSWGVCPRCSRRPCRCAIQRREGGEEDEDGG